VTLLRRARFPRGAAVATVYLVLLLAVAGIGVLLANPVANQVSAFRDEVPSIVDSANDNLANLQGWLDDNGIDLQVSKPGKTAVDSLGDRIAEGSGELVAFTRDALLRLAETSIALILIFVLSIYMLLYGERIGAAVRSVVPPGDGSAEDDFPTRIQARVFGYVRGQLLFSLIMGTSAGVCCGCSARSGSSRTARRTRSRSAPGTASPS
jgi:predicted PurR-regulated permease PerM